MSKVPVHPDRRTVRISGYDYAAPGVYFVTICTQQMRPLLGDVLDGHARLSRIGTVVDGEWRRTSSVRPKVALDRLLVMPNHIHAIVVITDGRRSQAEDFVGFDSFRPDPMMAMPFASPTGTVGSIVRGIKAASVRRVREMLGDGSFVLWQGGLYEHVVVDGEDLFRIREYIDENPLRWSEDRFHPGRAGPERSR